MWLLLKLGLHLRIGEFGDTRLSNGCRTIDSNLSWNDSILMNNFEAPLSQIVKHQNKTIRVINDVQLGDHIILIMSNWIFWNFVTFL